MPTVEQFTERALQRFAKGQFRQAIDGLKVAEAPADARARALYHYIRTWCNQLQGCALWATDHDLCLSALQEGCPGDVFARVIVRLDRSLVLMNSKTPETALAELEEILPQAEGLVGQPELWMTSLMRPLIEGLQAPGSVRFLPSWYEPLPPHLANPDPDGNNYLCSLQSTHVARHSRFDPLPDAPGGSDPQEWYPQPIVFHHTPGLVVARAHEALGLLKERTGRVNDARTDFARALRCLDESPQAGIWAGLVASRLARCEFLLGRGAEAAALASRARAIMREAGTPCTPLSARMRCIEVLVDLQQKNYASALDHVTRMGERLPLAFGRNSLAAVAVDYLVGRLAHERGDTDLASKHYTSALAAMERADLESQGMNDRLEVVGTALHGESPGSSPASVGCISFAQAELDGARRAYALRTQTLRQEIASLADRGRLS